jgi:hypothetical protein
MNNKKMIIIKMADKYNKAKTWVIKIYKCGKIMINQEVECNRVTKRDTRVTKRYLRDFLDIDIYKRSNDTSNKINVINCTIGEKYNTITIENTQGTKIA